MTEIVRSLESTFSTTTAVPRRWSPATVARPVPKLGPFEIDRKSEPFDVYNDVGSPHPFAAKRVWSKYSNAQWVSRVHLSKGCLNPASRSDTCSFRVRSSLPAARPVLPPSSVATPCLNASVSWPACVGERH